MLNSTQVREAMEKEDPGAAAQLEAAAAQARNPLMIGLLALTGLAGLAVLIGAIGTLMAREWGRKLLASGALAAAVLGVVSLVFQFLNGQMDPANNPALARLPADQRQAMQGMAMVGVVMGVVFGLAFVALYLWTWRYFPAEERRRDFA